MRLQKFIAHSGAASRRKGEDLILQGRVKVNNRIIKELGTKVDPSKDRVYLDGRRLKLEDKNIYIILNKPIGFVSSAKDEKGRHTVVDLIDVEERIYPVGRLDIDTTGLILLTNDGKLAHRLMHPSFEVPKTYIVTVQGKPDKTALKILRKGVHLGDFTTSPAEVTMLKNYERDSILRITIHEGKNHQVKRMFSKVGHEVKKLKRISIGEIELGGLEVGNYRYLEESEIKYLKGIQ
ncbi:MAG: pseudouridine synthase [Tissierellia bacterium]|nr:pseudouridine synthase [Tissierellia bacterium]